MSAQNSSHYTWLVHHFFLLPGARRRRTPRACANLKALKGVFRPCCPRICRSPRRSAVGMPATKTRVQRIVRARGRRCLSLDDAGVERREVVLPEVAWPERGCFFFRTCQRRTPRDPSVASERMRCVLFSCRSAPAVSVRRRHVPQNKRSVLVETFASKWYRSVGIVSTLYAAKCLQQAAASIGSGSASSSPLPACMPETHPTVSAEVSSGSSEYTSCARPQRGSRTRLRLGPYTVGLAPFSVAAPHPRVPRAM